MSDNDEHIKSVTDTLKYSLEQFDKSITFIASGAFGLSFAFIKDIVPDLKNAVDREYLIGSWYMFGIVVFISLVCHFVSMKAQHWAFQNQYLEAVEFNEKIKNWNLPIMMMNIAMIILTLIATITLILFINNNIFHT